MVFVCVCTYYPCSACRELFVSCTPHKQKPRYRYMKFSKAWTTASHRQHVYSKEKSQAVEQCQAASSGSSSQILRTVKGGQWWESPADGLLSIAEPGDELTHRVFWGYSQDTTSPPGKKSSFTAPLGDRAVRERRLRPSAKMNPTRSCGLIRLFEELFQLRASLQAQSTLWESFVQEHDLNKRPCFINATRGVREGEDGGGARLAGSCSPEEGAGQRLGPAGKRRIPEFPASILPSLKLRLSGNERAWPRSALCGAFTAPACVTSVLPPRLLLPGFSLYVGRQTQRWQHPTGTPS